MVDPGLYRIINLFFIPKQVLEKILKFSLFGKGGWGDSEFKAFSLYPEEIYDGKDQDAGIRWREDS